MPCRRASSPFPALVSVVLAAFVAVTAGSAFAEHLQGSGVVKSEARSVSGFHAVAVDLPAEVTLNQGNTEGLTLVTDDNIAPLVETLVENGTLKIRWARRNLSVKVKRLDIVIAAKAIDSLAVRGSADVRAPSLKSNTLSIAVDGSGELAIAALNVNSLKLSIRGDGQLTTAGRADTLDVAISGSGELRAPKLESQRARLALNGSAQATVWAKEELAATIAGSGEITYYGKPRVTQTIAGSGRIAAAGTS
jgi:putative autotransporter adhesin-like protein